MIGVDHRLNANKERPECPGGDVLNRGAVDSFPIDIGHTAGPGDGNRIRVEHADRGISCAFEGERAIERFKQVPCGCPVPTCRTNEVAGCGHPRRERAERGRARIEALAQLPFDANQGILVGGAKARPLEHAPTDRGQHREGEAGGGGAFQRLPAVGGSPGPYHTGPQNTRYSDIDLDWKLLLKRGALLAAANWPTVAIQFAAETTFQVMLAVPLVGAAVLVAMLLGADLGNLLQGGLNEIFTTIARALMSEPLALGAFVASFAIVLFGGSVLMFLVKGGIVEVLMASNAVAGPIEREPVTWDGIRSVSRFTLQGFMDGCTRLFRRYLTLGLLLMLVYALSGSGYVAFLVYGYRAAGDRTIFIGWAFVAALAAILLVVWITAVNLVYLLLQIAVATEDVGVMAAFRIIARLIRTKGRDLGGVFLVILVMIVSATFASALAWSGVGLIAFVPLVGLAVFPLQIAAWLFRGLVFEYISLTALGAYLTLYCRHVESLGMGMVMKRSDSPSTGVSASFP